MNAMKKMIVAAAVAVAGFAAFAADEGAAPSAETYAFTYQACLRDEKGDPIKGADGSVQRNQRVTIRLWTDATTTEKALWARKYAVYTDETGLFNLEVSDATSDDQGVDDGYGTPLYGSLVEALRSQSAGLIYIGLFVEGSSGEIVPRQRLFAVPYAAVANDVRAITKDITVGGDMYFGPRDQRLTLSPAGISHVGTNKSSFANLSVGTELSANTLTVNAGSTLQGGVNVNGGLTVGKGDLTVSRGDAAVSNNLTVAKNATVGVDATVKGNLKVDGTIKDAVAEVVPVPVGGIIMWTKSELPEPKDHWAICDGKDGKTPDLRGRFIVGVNDSTNLNGPNNDFATYSADDKGGKESVTLADTQIPPHKHHLSNGSNWYKVGVNDEHDYYIRSPMVEVGDRDPVVEPEKDRTIWKGVDAKGNAWSGEKNQKNEAYVDGDTASAGGDSNGKTVAHENRPPYYALYYIMRVK